MEEEEVREEALKKQQEKSELERTAARGVQGGMELKKEERNKFLGEFRERVLFALTFEQVEESGTSAQAREAIQDPEAKKVIINQEIDIEAARQYIKLAQEHELSFKKVASPELEGEIGLVVVSDHAVNRTDIYLKSREEYMKEKGIPEELIAATGQKLCADCYQLIADQVPGEIENYKQLSWWDKLFGAECPGKH